MSNSGHSLGIGFGPAPDATTRRESDAMHLLVIGDFGAGSSSATPIGERAVLGIDLDSLDAAMARIAPRLTIEIPGGELGFSPSSLDDFHPDALLPQLPEPPAALQPAPAEPTAPTEQASTTGEADSDTLTRLLGTTSKASSGASSATPSPADIVAGLIKQATESQSQPQPEPRSESAPAPSNSARAEQLLAVLQHPGFQALEAAWRGLDFLVNNLEIDENLTIQLLDASRDELAADLAAVGPDLGASQLGRRLHSERPLEDGWGALVCLFDLGPNDRDLPLALRLATVGASLHAPVLAGAAPELVGCESFAASPDPVDWGKPAAFDAWQALRTSPAAPWLGLAAPRLLLRRPYGKGSDAVDGLELAEIRSDPRLWLWGNAALGCALLMARSFAGGGWDASPDDQHDIEELPFPMVRTGLDLERHAAGETYLSDRAVETLLEAGIMALSSDKRLDRVRLVRFQSIASPAQALAGRWK